METHPRARAPPTVPQNGLLASMSWVGDQTPQEHPGLGQPRESPEQFSVHTHALSEETPASGCCGQAWATLGPRGQ